MRCPRICRPSFVTSELLKSALTGKSVPAVPGAKPQPWSIVGDGGAAKRRTTPDDRALHATEDALRIAERSSDDTVVGYIRAALALALMHRQKAAERDRGQKLGAEVGEVLRTQGRNLCDLPIIEVYLARERARAGDRDDALALMRSTVDHLFRTGRLLIWNNWSGPFAFHGLSCGAANSRIATARRDIQGCAAA